MAQGGNQTAQQRKIAENATKVHEWPSEAGDCDVTMYDIYVKNQEFRAYQDWLAGDLIELARVSKLQAVSIDEMDKYIDEGAIILAGKNGDTKVENPRGRAVATLNGTITSMMRRLGITITGVAGADKKPAAGRARAELDAKAKLPPTNTKVDEADAGDFLN